MRKNTKNETEDIFLDWICLQNAPVDHGGIKTKVKFKKYIPF